MSRNASKRPHRADSHSDVRLPHWSTVEPHRHSRPAAPQLAAVLTELLDWFSDVVLKMTDFDPDDAAALARVRAYVRARLYGTEPPPFDLDDVVVSVANLIATLDLQLKRAEEES
ncbi:MAG TPA: hypothetical protein VGM88_13105 [Kofleriaceae bacterium]|jgi:hypothetical protein